MSVSTIQTHLHVCPVCGICSPACECPKSEFMSLTCSYECAEIAWRHSQDPRPFPEKKERWNGWAWFGLALAIAAIAWYSWQTFHGGFPQ